MHPRIFHTNGADHAAPRAECAAAAAQVKRMLHFRESTVLTSDVIVLAAGPFDRLFTICATVISGGNVARVEFAQD